MLHKRHTLLIILRSFIARLDGIGRADPRIVTVARGPHDDLDESLESCVERAIGLGGRLQGPTWVLSDEVVAISVTLDARATRGITDDDLGAALALEAQARSGVASSDSTTAWRMIGESRGQRSFWVTQLADAEMEWLDGVIRRAGGAFRGVAHPAGLLRPYSTRVPSERPFLRVEDWGTIHAEVERTEPGTIAVRLRAGSAERSGNVAQDGRVTERLALLAPAHESRVDGDVDANDTDVLVLERDRDLARFGAAWLAELRARKSSAIVLRPAPPPPSIARVVLYSVTLSALVIAWAYRNQRELESRRTEIVAETALLRTAADNAAASRRTLIGLRRQADELDAKPALAVDTARWSGEVPSRLLATLADERPDGLAVLSLDVAWNRSALRGVAADAAAVDRLVASLARALQADGYDVATSGKRSLGRHFEFEVSITRPTLRARSTRVPRAAAEER
ncbi:MAG: hypothetical protein AB7O52_09470 [Planctomycetota bacterium]